MASDPEVYTSLGTARTRLPLGSSKRKIAYERRLRIWLALLALPTVCVGVAWWLNNRLSSEATAAIFVLFALGWLLLTSILMKQILRPLQTLSNVIAALREDDYSFRARGGRRNDALGNLALEINALASMLQSQRAGALEALALTQRVMESMQSPMIAFDPAGRLALLNAAGEKVFGVNAQEATGRSAAELHIERLRQFDDRQIVSLGDAAGEGRWITTRTTFRLNGESHLLLVFSDVSSALREEERAAWQRLIRVLGHEINNSLTPIKSIAATLRTRCVPALTPEDTSDLCEGLTVIEDRADSLNRFLQAYQQLMRLPHPVPTTFVVSELIERVVPLETRLTIRVVTQTAERMHADMDQVEQALINLIRNATEAATSPDAGAKTACVEVHWRTNGKNIEILIRDNGAGVGNSNNLFVPFYTTKLNGTGVGLVLAQQIAEAHGGTVLLDDRTDGVTGCDAIFRIPAVTD